MTQEQINYLRTRLDYVSSTGKFIWLSRPDDCKGNRVFNVKFAGKIAGTINNEGYCKIWCEGNIYFSHRIVWAFTNGPIPPGMMIDHIDGNPLNNNITNLRQATHAQNSQNMRCRAASGFKNVRRNNKGWGVKITANGKVHWFGTYPTIEEAAAVAKRERARLHGEFARAA